MKMDLKEASVNNFSTYRLSTSYHNIVKINLKRAVIGHIVEFKEFMSKYHPESNKDLILDFTETNFVDSSFSGTIISLLKKVKLGEGSLSLVINSSIINFLLPV